MTNKETGDLYEKWVLKIIGKIIQDIKEDFVTKRNVKLSGYQIDIYSESPESIIFTECKNYKDKIQHGKIDQFIAKISRIKAQEGLTKKIYGIFISSSFFYDNVIGKIYDRKVIPLVFNINSLNPIDSISLYRIKPINFGNHIVLYDYSKEGVKISSLRTNNPKIHLSIDYHYDTINSIHSNLNERVNSCLEILLLNKGKNDINVYENLNNALYHLNYYEDAYTIAKFVENNINKTKLSNSDKKIYGLRSLMVQSLSQQKMSIGNKYPAKKLFYRLRNEVLNSSISEMSLSSPLIFMGEWLCRYSNNYDLGIKYLNKGKDLALKNNNVYMTFTSIRKRSQVSKDEIEKDNYIAQAKELIKELKGNYKILANDYLKNENEKFRK
ncbi:MAG: hypothetical protein AB7G44_12030 [Bacteroidia bacterium]